MATNTQQVDAKAVRAGVVDGVLTIVFQALGQLAAYAITLLPFLDTFQQGKWSWVKFPLGVALGAAVKALDRKKHEDSTSSTGLISV